MRFFIFLCLILSLTIISCTASNTNTHKEYVPEEQVTTNIEQDRSSHSPPLEEKETSKKPSFPTVGDTITKGEYSVTVYELTEDYVPLSIWLTRVLKNWKDEQNNLFWKPEELEDIEKIYFSRGTTYQEREETRNELNRKYGNRMETGRKWIYQKIEYKVQRPITKETPTLFGDPLEDWESFIYLENTDKMYPEWMENSLYTGYFKVWPVDEAEGKGYFVIQWDGCARTLEKILAAREGTDCPLTFVFDIQLSKGINIH